jgi:L-threonylcarbamoyladenylate synthase
MGVYGSDRRQGEGQLRHHGQEEIDAAAKALAGGGLVLLPTETVYGLGADASNPAAVAAIFEARAGRASTRDRPRPRRRGRRADRRVRRSRPGPGRRLLARPPDHRRPGARHRRRLRPARAGLDTVAIRVPGHPLSRAVLATFGGAVVAPSANRSGRPSPTTFDDAFAETGDKTAAALDGGPCAVGLESTVVAVLDGPVRLLRPGAVTRAQLEAVVGPLAEADDDAKRSPGRLALHYAPDAPVRIEAAAPATGEAFLAFGPWPEGEGVFNLSPAGDLAEAAANLFAFLRAADRIKPSAIAVASIPDEGLGEAINDRLRRAAGFIG